MTIINQRSTTCMMWGEDSPINTTTSKWPMRPERRVKMQYQATKESLDTHSIPEWYSDAKLGIFIHWGLYSLPAFAERNPSYSFQNFMHDLMDLQDCGGRIPY